MSDLLHEGYTARLERWHRTLRGHQFETAMDLLEREIGDLIDDDLFTCTLGLDLQPLTRAIPLYRPAVEDAP